MTIKVAMCTPDWLAKPPGQPARGIGGAGYYRMRLPAEMLNKHDGNEFVCQVFPGCWSHPKTGELYPAITQDPHNHDRLICDETGWDIIVLQRWMAETDRRRILAARAHGQAVLQDVDDHFWGVHKANRAFKETRREDWNADYYRANLAASTHITVSTRYLADHLADLDVPVTVLPNMIDLTLWERQPVRDQVDTVGWCGHTGYRSGDLETVGNSIRYFLRDHPHITFIHGGHDPAARHISELLNIPKHRVKTRLSCSIERWPRIWEGIDIAILPLNAVEFNSAKSAIKALEASAAGVPFIATEFGPYIDYGQGVLVDSPAEWLAALNRMTKPATTWPKGNSAFDPPSTPSQAYTSSEFRQQLADTAYQRVQAEDANRRWTEWADLYRQHT